MQFCKNVLNFELFLILNLPVYNVDYRQLNPIIKIRNILKCLLKANNIFKFFVLILQFLQKMKKYNFKIFVYQLLIISNVLLKTY